MILGSSLFSSTAEQELKYFGGVCLYCSRTTVLQKPEIFLHAKNDLTKVT